MKYEYLHGRLLNFVQDDVSDFQDHVHNSKLMLMIQKWNSHDLKAPNSWRLVIELCLYAEGWIESPRIISTRKELISITL